MHIISVSEIHLSNPDELQVLTLISTDMVMPSSCPDDPNADDQILTDQINPFTKLEITT